MINSGQLRATHALRCPLRSSPTSEGLHFICVAGAKDTHLWIAQQFVIKSFSKSVTFYDEKMEKSADRTFLVVEDFDKWVQQIITSNVGLQNAAVSIFNIKPPFLPQHMICISFVAAKSLFLHWNVFQKTTQRFTF